MGGGFPIKAFGNDKLVLTEVGNGPCITYLPNIYDAQGGEKDLKRGKERNKTICLLRTRSKDVRQAPPISVFLPLNLSELCAFAVNRPVSFKVQKMAI